MSLQPSSHPEARSLIAVFSLSSLLSLLDHFWHTLLIFRSRSETSHAVSVSCGRGPRGPDSGSGSTSRPNLDHICHDENCKKLGIFFPQLFQQNKAEWECVFKKLREDQGFRGQNKFIFKGCRKASGKKGLVSLKIFSLNQLKIRIF